MDIKTALKGQHRSAFAMLCQTIELCPDDLWYDERFTNQYMRSAFHALHFGHLYMMPCEKDFVPWEHARGTYWRLGRHEPDAQNPPYTQAELLQYADHIDTLIDDAIDRCDLDSDDCGFPWYKLSKMEHIMLNIRHIQHHAGQLADRLREQSDIGIGWRG